MADYSYVALLDILGYKNLLEADVKAGKQTFKEKMIAAFRVFDSVNQANFSHQAISDSIFITCSERSSIHELLSLISKVFCSFLEQGLLIRGGISYGEHFQNNTITYSPALTKAYLLESKLADFPRIMVDPNIYEMFPDVFFRRTILRSGPNWFVNVINQQNHFQVWQNAESIFNNFVEEITSLENVRAKHRWLQDYILEACDYMGLDTSNKMRYISVFDHELPLASTDNKDPLAQVR